LIIVSLTFTIFSTGIYSHLPYTSNKQQSHFHWNLIYLHTFFLYFWTDISAIYFFCVENPTS